MDFEFDPAKSKANESKHGLDFDSARALWEDPDRVEIPARTTDEPRWIVIGRIDSVPWSAIITRRGEWTRIISVRRARPEEVIRYEEG